MCLLANVVKLQGYATRGDTSAGGGRRGGATFCLFFFQAEDGIRDTSVTGVQTCALPISPIRGTVHDVAARPGPAHGRGGTRLVPPPVRRGRRAEALPDRGRSRRRLQRGGRRPGGGRGGEIGRASCRKGCSGGGAGGQ